MGVWGSEAVFPPHPWRGFILSSKGEPPSEFSLLLEQTHHHGGLAVLLQNFRGVPYGGAARAEFLLEFGQKASNEECRPRYVLAK